MKKIITIGILLAITLSLLFIGNQEKTEKLKPGEWMFLQRAYPEQTIDQETINKSFKSVKENLNLLNKSAASWQAAGPLNIAGRITDVEANPNNNFEVYAGTASGGVFKSTNTGKDWYPIFDETGISSIGDIAIDPSDPNIIFVGTGESNPGGGSISYPGGGIFKSSDGGSSWSAPKLENIKCIARVAVHPTDSKIIFVAGLGNLYSKDKHRGIYRSSDGGENWEKVFFVSDSTGCCDIVFHPQNPQIIYAAMWERYRTPSTRHYGGEEGGIYRSTDGGETWHELTNNLPQKDEEIGRIGLAVCYSEPEKVFAIYSDKTGYFNGIYRSDNNGQNWTLVNNDSHYYFYSSYGWWFGNIRVNPQNVNEIWVLGVGLWSSTDGGQNWIVDYDPHVDHHGLYIDINNPDFKVLGTDGGVYFSMDETSEWIKKSDMPITQFYSCEVDYQNPERLYGGAQDNFVIRTTTGNHTDWHPLIGGDGLQVIVDPEDNNYIYAESQRGYLQRSTDGGITFNPALTGTLGNSRFNWNAPIEMDPNNTSCLYFGGERIYKTTNRAQNWEAISDNLTANNIEGYSAYGTITTIEVANTNSNMILAGTDDGNLWITENGGSNWTEISNGLPTRWITRVLVDPTDENIVYVTLSGYKRNENLAHVFRSTDKGMNWKDISNDLPDLPVNDIIVDPENTNNLFIANDAGVYFSDNLGSSWIHLNNGMPIVQVSQIKIHNPTRTLIAGTYGRSMYKMDLRDLTDIARSAEHTPNEFKLNQNYPNPFNPSTKISYELPAESDVKIVIYDILGKQVAEIVNERKQAGNYETSFNANNLASGTYICKMNAGNISKVIKIQLIK